MIHHKFPLVIFLVRSVLFSFFFAMASSSLHAEAINASLPLIEVTGKGKVSAKPDQALLSLNFSETELKLEEARDEVDKQVEALLKQLKKFEIDSGSLDSSQVSINPRYDYRPNNQRHFVGYQVNRQVSFKLNQLDQLDTLIEAISSEKINRLDSISFVHSDPEALRLEALDKAIVHSKLLAEKIADAYERDIDKIHQVSYQSPSQHSAPRMMRMEMASADAKGSSYQQKELDVEVQVHASFLLK